MAWNNEDGFIAIGGNDGLLKVLKLDTGTFNLSFPNVYFKAETKT